jgi:hypothetical protein
MHVAADAALQQEHISQCINGARRHRIREENIMTTATIRISSPLGERPASAARTPAAPPARPWYRRLLDAMIEARMAQAEGEVRRIRGRDGRLDAYRQLTPIELEAAAAHLSARTKSQLPFIRD